MSKLTLVLITKNLPPDIGGMETMWFNAVKELAELTNLHVIAPQKCQPFVEQYCTFHPTPNSFPLFLLSATAKAVSLVRRGTPNTYLLSGSGLTLLPAVLSGKLTGNKSVVYLHGLDICFPNPIYQAVFRTLIGKADAVVVNSNNTKKLACDAGVKVNKIAKIPPYVTPLTKVNVVDKNYLLDDEDFNLVYFGRVIPRKGLLEFIQFAFPKIIEEKNRARLHVIGDNPCDETNKYLQKIVTYTQHNAVDKHITFWGQLERQALISVVQQCSVHVFPLVECDNDVEGFGIVILEADSLGVPTVTFDCGGAKDAVELSQSAVVVEPKSYETFVSEILRAENKQTQRKDTQVNSTGKSWHTFASDLLEFCKISGT